jgi:hypothetical protein
MRVLTVALALFLALVGRSQAQNPNQADPMSSIAWLAGDWEAEPKGAAASSSNTRVAYHFHPVLGGRELTLEATFNGMGRFQGMIGYDPARRSVAVWYITTTGESSAGLMTPEDGYSLFDINVTSLEGKTTHLQVRIVHVDADHYRWEIYADPKGTGMAKLFETSYRRLK